MKLLIEIPEHVYEHAIENSEDSRDEFDAMRAIANGTPQQRTGRWEFVRYDGLMGNWHCSECRTIIPHMPEEKDNTPIYKWCPMCGAKMEVEEWQVKN